MGDSVIRGRACVCCSALHDVEEVEKEVGWMRLSLVADRRRDLGPALRLASLSWVVGALEITWEMFAWLFLLANLKVAAEYVEEKEGQVRGTNN
jgi:hypothetical protein